MYMDEECMFSCSDAFGEQPEPIKLKSENMNIH